MQETSTVGPMRMMGRSTGHSTQRKLAKRGRAATIIIPKQIGFSTMYTVIENCFVEGYSYKLLTVKQCSTRKVSVSLKTMTCIKVVSLSSAESTLILCSFNNTAHGFQIPKDRLQYPSRPSYVSKVVSLSIEEPTLMFFLSSIPQITLKQCSSLEALISLKTLIC